MSWHKKTEMEIGCCEQTLTAAVKATVYEIGSIHLHLQSSLSHDVEIWYFTISSSEQHWTTTETQVPDEVHP